MKLSALQHEGAIDREGGYGNEALYRSKVSLRLGGGNSMRRGFRNSRGDYWPGIRPGYG